MNSLRDYHRKRTFDKTPEPRGADPATDADQNRFVIHEHHATRLHWDLRLERDGVLASFALPRCLPFDPAENRMAVHTEDHPIEYLDFHGDIPQGEYGGGTMTVWDTGTYEELEWKEGKAVVRLHGTRAEGTFALFSAGQNWLIHRMGGPPEGYVPLPSTVEPMPASPGPLPRDESQWGFELLWRGVRTVAFCEPGHVRLQDGELGDVTSGYPELGALARNVGGHRLVLDGMLVAFDDAGKPSLERLQRRLAQRSRPRRQSVPVVYVIFDLLHHDDASLLDLPYTERRQRLDALGLAGTHWQLSPWYEGEGRDLLAACVDLGLDGVVAKRLTSPYRPGEPTKHWRTIAAPPAE